MNLSYAAGWRQHEWSSGKGAMKSRRSEIPQSPYGKSSPAQLSMKPAAVEKRVRRQAEREIAAARRETAKKTKAAILQDTPPWLIGLKETHLPVTVLTLRRLGLWLSTFSEAAAFLGISPHTLSRRMQEHPVLRKAWDEGQEQGRSTLRRRQLEVAFSDSPQAASLLVHLGKTLLGQHERRELVGDGGGPIRFGMIRRVIVDPMAPEGQQEIDVTEPETRH
jgi:hypothetical protein